VPEMKVKEVADSLKTKSKRIIEKLEEIKISGKGPMSKLTEDEIQKLYDYIGLIRPSEKEETEPEKVQQPKKEIHVKPVSQQEKPAVQHKGQYIIRRVEKRTETRENDNNLKKDPKKRYIVSSDDSGLLSGLTTTKSKYKRPPVQKKEQKPFVPKPEVEKPKPKEEIKEKPAAPEVVKKEPEPPKPKEVKAPEVKPEVKQEVKPEAKPEKKEFKKPEHTRKPFKAAEKKPVPAPTKPKEPRPQRESKPPYFKDKDKDEEKPAAKGARTAKKPVKAVEKPAFETVAKPEKSADKKPGKKIEQQKQSKKESAVENAKVSKKTAKGTDEINPVDLKTTARLFSEEQVAKSGIDDEKVLDFYSKSTSKYKTRNRRNKPRKSVQREIQKPSIPSEIKIDEAITVKELAEMIKKTAGAVILKLMNLGVMATANETIDFDTATIIAEEFGVKTALREIKTEEDILFDDSEEEGELVTRPPIVVVMGHVDHGKTSLLDAIKNTNVMDSEAGGITQHIGAYMVNVHGRDITFLDTPGHEAFTSLRARGAQVTDIAIIVVAADDGIMPQTVEAINHAKAAGVSIIVAINKIDKPNANIERVKQELTEHELVPEEWGGDTVCVPISAKLNENITELLDMVILTADLLDLKADPKKQAKGTVIDASLDKNRGVITTLIVQRGELKLGDSVVTGTTVGRIRAMNDYRGEPLDKAGPSTPVEIIGMPEVPEAGELFYSIEDQRLARQLAEKRKNKQREESIRKQNAVTLEDLFSKIGEGQVKELNLILKADVQGSIEALKQSLVRLSNDEVSVKVIHDAVGTINETDVSLAQVADAIIIGFNVRPPATVVETAESVGVEIKLYNIIYEAIEDVENALKGMLKPKLREEVLGHAQIRETFKVSGIGTIAGCYVQDGKLVRNAKIRLIRDGIVVHTGELASLKRFKDDVREVASGYECGTSIEKFNDIKIGDVIEAYHVVEEERR